MDLLLDGCQTKVENRMPLFEQPALRSLRIPALSALKIECRHFSCGERRDTQINADLIQDTTRKQNALQVVLA